MCKRNVKALSRNNAAVETISITYS